MGLNEDWDAVRSEAERAIRDCGSLKELEALRIRYLGKKGLIAGMYAAFRSLPVDRRPEAGRRVNDLKARLTALLEDRKTDLKRASEGREEGPTLDVTLPGVSLPRGRRHVLSQMMTEICGIFVGMGFVVQEGPEIETEFHNFTALNIPADHPSRDAFDTFYLENEDPDRPGRRLLLRSHTSPGQIRIMESFDPPLAVVIPGKVYRPDAVDASHSFMFHQIEGLLVDRRVRFSDLKGLVSEFCRRFFGPRVTMRFRPHFFPFTEPSAEVDIACEMCGGSGCSVCGRKGWLEIMGCGLVHPAIFDAVGYPSGEYSGLAFGMGVERMTMLRYGVRDIRIFYENDREFVRQF